MGERGRELVATDEPTVVAKPFLNAIVVENGQGDGSFPNPTRPDESDWCATVGETNDLLDQFVASETGPWRRGWGFSGYARHKYEMLNSLVVDIAHLV